MSKNSQKTSWFACGPERMGRERNGINMIYTVTLNPSLDYIVTVDDFKLEMTNRTSSEKMLPGGKGINVSIILQNLGIENTALGFSAGFVGDEIIREIEDAGIRSDFVRLDHGVSRINMKLISIDGTEINGQGPDIYPEELKLLHEKLEALTDQDYLVLAGSIPNTMPADIYQTIIARMEQKGVTVLVDATRDLLLNVLPYHPFLIKPNHHELGEIFDVELQAWEDVIPYAKKLQERGARNVMVSMGGKGGVLVAEDGQILACESAARQVVNTVGAGDSSVAGFLAGWMERGDYRHAFRKGMAAGGASAGSEDLATKEEIDEIYEAVEVVDLTK